MIKKTWAAFCLALSLVAASPVVSLADTTDQGVTTMENCGAYLFEWRPIDCGNGHYFAILVGGNTIAESDVILNRGYDYAYTFNSLVYGKPWGQVPELVNVNGVWAIPENQPLLPAGTQPTLQIVLYTNNGKLPDKYRYIDVVSLPAGVDTSTLPADVRKYLINVDGSDAGAYNGTVTSGWVNEADGSRRYRKPDGTYVTNGWLNVDDELYYMDANGVMLKDTITPDGIYVNANGEKTSYIPGWYWDPAGFWRYIQKNGYYMSNGWLQDVDGKWYYFNLGAQLETNDMTPDGYYVDANGVWDGQPSTMTESGPSIGPAEDLAGVAGRWEQLEEGWKYRKADGTYVSNGWYQTPDGKWYYFGADAVMLANTTTPDGYYVDASGAWNGQAANQG